MRAKEFFCITSAVAALICGCATKSPPTRANIQADSGLTNLNLSSPWKGAPLVTNAVEDNWLATFNDPQLDALITEALVHNPDLRVTAMKVEQSAQYVELARAALRPTLNLAGTGGFNMGGGDVSSALQGIALGASWEPDLWGRLRYGRNAAQASYASAQADFEFARQSLAAGVAKAWFAVTETLQQMEITQDMVESGEQLVTLSTQRQSVGAGNEQDVAMARASLGNFQDTAKQMRLAHHQALRALEVLLGRYPAAELAVRRDFAKVPAEISVGVPLEMLERRPDLIAAERRVAAAFNLVGQAKAAQLPRIILNASFGAINSDVLQLKSDFSNPVGGAGAKLIAPIYQGGALKTQVKIRTLEQREAVADYARLALRAINDVESALANEHTLADREQTLRQVLTDSEQALSMAQVSYRVGRGDLRRVQEQQISVYAARLTLLGVQSGYLAGRVNLHLALGGSFESKPVQVSQTTTR